MALWLWRTILKLKGDKYLKGLGAKDKEVCHLLLNSTANTGNTQREGKTNCGKIVILESKRPANYRPLDQI